MRSFYLLCFSLHLCFVQGASIDHVTPVSDNEANLPPKSTTESHAGEPVSFEDYPLSDTKFDDDDASSDVTEREKASLKMNEVHKQVLGTNRSRNSSMNQDTSSKYSSREATRRLNIFHHVLERDLSFIFDIPRIINGTINDQINRILQKVDLRVQSVSEKNAKLCYHDAVAAFKTINHNFETELITLLEDSYNTIFRSLPLYIEHLLKHIVLMNHSLCDLNASKHRRLLRYCRRTSAQVTALINTMESIEKHTMNQVRQSLADMQKSFDAISASTVEDIDYCIEEIQKPIYETLPKR